MKAYVINLDRRPDRLESFAARAAECGLSFERLSAVDGQDPAVRADYSAMPKGFSTWPMGAVAHACFQSHRKAWAKLLDSGEPFAAVLEDDIVMAGDLERIISHQPTWIPDDADIIRLETYLKWAIYDRKKVGSILGRRLHRLRSLMFGTGAYIVSAKAARHLLQATERFGDPIDIVLYEPVSPVSHTLVVYQLIPAPVIQGHLLPKAETGAWAESTIGTERTDVYSRMEHDAAAKRFPLKAVLALLQRKARGAYERIAYLKTVVPYN